MKGPPPPLRFLILVIGGWTAARAVFFAPAWLARPVEAAAPSAPVRIASAGAPPSVPASARPALSRAKARGVGTIESTAAGPLSPQPSLLRSQPPRLVSRPSPSPGRKALVALLALPPPRNPPLAASPVIAVPRPQRRSRWSLSAWSFVRGGEGRGLAPGGTLGGAQAGLRVGYRLGSRIALAGRAYAPLRRPQAAEAAAGLDWQPLRGTPIRLLAERRQKLGRDGRSAFAITAYGGVSEVAAGPLRLDAYGQAGLVGGKQRVVRAAGADPAALPLGPFRAGAGAWAAAQPGVSRFDIGPHASLRLPLSGRTVTLAADWRIRVAGDARPGSGPALTLASDF